MRTIEIDCPGCQTKLELDSGFAGGVCRCSNCGTMMTVPADPKHERAERLTRPDRPDAPGGPPGRSPAPRSPAAAPRTSGRPEAPGRPGQPPEDDEVIEATLDDDAEAGGAGDTEVFTTASGKLFRVPKRLVVTAKAKRKVIRGGVIAVFVILVVLMVSAAAFAIWIMLKPSAKGPTPQEQQLAMTGYDPSVNPFKLARANFLGIPLLPGAVVTVDASESSSAWLATVKKSVVIGTRPLPADARFQVIFWVEGGSKAYPDEAKFFGKSERAGLAGFLDGVTASGAATPGPAVRKAVGGNANQVIVATGQSIDPAELASIGKTLQAKPDIEFDAVVLGDEDSPELRKLVDEHHGKYVSLPTSRLNEWYHEAEDAGVFNQTN